MAPSNIERLSPAAMNRANAEFWDKKRKRQAQLLTIPSLALAIVGREFVKASVVGLAPSAATRINLLRRQTSFGEELELLADELRAPASRVVQREKASQPRGAMDSYGTRIGDIIIQIASLPGNSEKCPKALWPELRRALFDRSLKPKEINGDNLRRWEISYQFKNRRKTITFGRFSNILSSHKKSR